MAFRRQLLLVTFIGLTSFSSRAHANDVAKPLPRVLLIGDSISIGYTKPTQLLLEGIADVQRIPANGGPTTRGINSIDKWLGKTSWDVIHFNWGIHDLKYMAHGKRQVEPTAYKMNLRSLVKRLQKTNAKLIWATTTPIPKQMLIGKRLFGDEAEYNRIAEQIMKENGIQINDLHTHMLPRFKEFHIADDLHFKPTGSDFLAQQVAKAIQETIEAKN